MTQANSMYVEGTNASFATHKVGDRPYQVAIRADAYGNLENTTPVWGFVIPMTPNAADKGYFDIFNNEAGTLLLFRKLFAIPVLDASTTGSIGIRLDTFRTKTAGSGGTALKRTNTPDRSVAAFWSFDPTQEALPAGVTGRALPTGGATAETWLWPSYVRINETDPAAFDQQYLDLMLNLPQALVLSPGYGLRVTQGPNAAGNGQVQFLGAFTLVPVPPAPQQLEP